MNRTPFCTQLFKKITKNDHFRRFPFLPRRFKWSYLSHFLEIWPEIFFGTSKHLKLAKWKKKLGYPDLKILFSGQLTQKTDFFGAIFGFCGQIFLWSHLRRATNFYMMVVAFIRNFHFKFEVIPFIFVVTMKKKLFIFRFRGPFWVLLGTPL